MNEKLTSVKLGRVDTDQAGLLDRSRLFVLSKTIRTAWDELLIRRAPGGSRTLSSETLRMTPAQPAHLFVSLETGAHRRLTSQPNRSSCSFVVLELLRHKRHHSFQLRAAGRGLSGFTWVLLRDSSVRVGSWTKGPVLLVFRTLLSAANLVHDVNNKPKLKISSYLQLRSSLQSTTLRIELTDFLFSSKFSQKLVDS